MSDQALVLVLPWIFFVLALIIQLPWIRAMGQRWHGDEDEYIRRARREGPYREDRHAPALFLRLPVQTWYVSLAGAAWGRLQVARWLSSLLSAAQVALTVSAAQNLGGWPLAGLSGVVLVLLLERAVVAVTMWPDVLIGGCAVLCFLYLLHLTTFGSATVLWTAVASLAVLVASGSRPDGIFLALGTVSAARVLGASWVDLVWLVAPAIVLLAWWTLRARKRYGLPWPETTFAFNLALSSGELPVVGPPRGINEIVRGAMPSWTKSEASTPGRTAALALRAHARRPVASLVAVSRRALSLFGPDTFVSQRLLSGEGSLCDLGDRQRRLTRVLLKWSLPLWSGALSAACIVLLWQPELASGVLHGRYAGSFAVISLPFAFLFVAVALVHTRTRYRFSLLPFGAILVGMALRVLFAATTSLLGTIALVFGSAVALMLATHPLVVEVHKELRRP